MIMPQLWSTYDGRLIYKTFYEGRKAFLRYEYDSLANTNTIHLQSCKMAWDSVRKLRYGIPKRNFSTF